MLKEIKRMLKLIRNHRTFSLVLNKLKVCIHSGSESHRKRNISAASRTLTFKDFPLNIGIFLGDSEKLDFFQNINN